MASLSSSSSSSSSSAALSSSSPSRLPVSFLSHGGGPCFFMKVPPSSPLYGVSEGSDAAKWYQSLPSLLHPPSSPLQPSAILVVSAHWVTQGQRLRVTSKKQHERLYYDYGGFPDHTYKLQFNPPGAPALSSRICQLLKKGGIECVEDGERDFDHGVFIPLLLAYPKAHIPVVELSIDASYSPSFHFKVGEALQTLRDEGVLIIGSGQTTHNFHGNQREANIFTQALTAVIEKEKKERDQALLNWAKLPAARDAHPEEDHLVPIFVCAGAAGEGKGKMIGEFWAGHMGCTNYLFP